MQAAVKRYLTHVKAAIERLTQLDESSSLSVIEPARSARSNGSPNEGSQASSGDDLRSASTRERVRRFHALAGGGTMTDCRGPSSRPGGARSDEIIYHERSGR